MNVDSVFKSRNEWFVTRLKYIIPYYYTYSKPEGWGLFEWIGGMMVAKWWGISVGFVGWRGCGERFFLLGYSIFSVLFSVLKPSSVQILSTRCWGIHAQVLSNLLFFWEISPQKSQFLQISLLWYIMCWCANIYVENAHVDPISCRGDFRRFSRKMHFFCNFFAKKFAD